jgi:hypothetical protein
MNIDRMARLHLHHKTQVHAETNSIEGMLKLCRKWRRGITESIEAEARARCMRDLRTENAYGETK